MPINQKENNLLISAAWLHHFMMWDRANRPGLRVGHLFLGADDKQSLITEEIRQQ